MANEASVVFGALALVVCLGCGSATNVDPAPALADAAFDAAIEDASPAAETSSDAPVTETSSGGESIAVVNECEVPTPAKPSEVNAALDVEYGTVDAMQQRLDVAWPKDAKGPRPLVVMIHGGGWKEGSKAGLRPKILLLAKLGYVAATIEYRLATATSDKFPAAVQDVRCAVRFLRANAAKYSIDEARVASIGHSAGGHLSSMLGAASEAPGLDDPSCPSASAPVAVTASIVLSGPADLDAFTPAASGFDEVSSFVGAPPPNDTAKKASPIRWVDAKDPPYLLVHGTTDPTVPVAQAVAMHGALKKAGVPVTYIELPLGHMIEPFGADPAVRSATCTSLAFLRKHLGP